MYCLISETNISLLTGTTATGARGRTCFRIICVCLARARTPGEPIAHVAGALLNAAKDVVPIEEGSGNHYTLSGTSLLGSGLHVLRTRAAEYFSVPFYCNHAPTKVKFSPDRQTKATCTVECTATSHSGKMPRTVLVT